MYRSEIPRKIPFEVILEIGKQATLDTLASMCRVNTTWNQLLTIVLYKKAINISEETSDSSTITPIWRVLLDYQESTLRRFLQCGLKNDE